MTTETWDMTVEAQAMAREAWDMTMEVWDVTMEAQAMAIGCLGCDFESQNNGHGDC